VATVKTNTTKGIKVIDLKDLEDFIINTLGDETVPDLEIFRRKVREFGETNAFEMPVFCAGEAALAQLDKRIEKEIQNIWGMEEELTKMQHRLEDFKELREDILRVTKGTKSAIPEPPSDLPLKDRILVYMANYKELPVNAEMLKEAFADLGAMTNVSGLQLALDELLEEGKVRQTNKGYLLAAKQEPVAFQAPDLPLKREVYQVMKEGETYTAHDLLKLVPKGSVGQIRTALGHLAREEHIQRVTRGKYRRGKAK
jgi:hypothetical protein